MSLAGLAVPCIKSQSLNSLLFPPAPFRLSIQSQGQCRWLFLSLTVNRRVKRQLTILRLLRRLCWRVGRPVVPLCASGYGLYASSDESEKEGLRSRMMSHAGARPLAHRLALAYLLLPVLAWLLGWFR